MHDLSDHRIRKNYISTSAASHDGNYSYKSLVSQINEARLESVPCSNRNFG